MKNDPVVCPKVRGHILATFFAAVCALSWAAEPALAQADLGTPAVEVKLLLDPAKVLDAHGQPTREMFDLFGVESSGNIEKHYNSMKIAMEFLDDFPERSLDCKEWNIRFRK